MTLKLLLQFVHEQSGKSPAQLDWDDLDATLVSAFLNHLESQRQNSVRTRNVRLTAIRSLFSYAALRHPVHALLIQRVLAIPPKRFAKRIVTFLTPPEVDALIAAPDQSRWDGRRDRVLMLLAIQTGLRVSELTGLNCADITLCRGRSGVRGRGRRGLESKPIFRASVARSMPSEVESCKPTTLRLSTSRTNAAKTQPENVRM